MSPPRIETFKPAAAESRSLKTPTTCGRLSPSMTRGSEPVALKVVRVGSAASVSAHPLGRSATGVESNTRSRRTTSTRAGASEDSGRQWQQIRSGAHRRHPGGSSRDERSSGGGNSLIDAHGIDASMRNGVYETNGASTLVVDPACGQLTAAVSCSIGRNGIEPHKTMPRMDATNRNDPCSVRSAGSLGVGKAGGAVVATSLSVTTLDPSCA